MNQRNRNYHSPLAGLFSAGLLLTVVHGHTAEFTDVGHYDLNVGFSNNLGWVFNWFDFNTTARKPTGEVDIGPSETALTTVPSGSAWARLGEPAGSPVWIIPQIQTPGVVFMGYRTVDLDRNEFFSTFGTPFIGLRVTSVRGSGPDRGGFFSGYQTALGDPVFQFASADGLDSADVVAPIPLGAHAHFNWAFTRPGEYQVMFEAEGQHRTGVNTNGMGTFTFFVPGGMTNLHLLDSGHIGFSMDLSGNALEMTVSADIEGIAGGYANKRRSPEEALLYDRAADIENTVPSSAAFGFLGSPGDKVWIFPQSLAPQTIYLGLNSEAITNGSLLNNQVEFRLIDVVGPTNGSFSCFQLDVANNPIVHLNSADGIDPATDRIVFNTGSHDHFNWAFTRIGQYEIAFQLAATNSAGSNLVSRVYRTHFGIGTLPGFRDDDGNSIDDHWEFRHGFTTPADPNADPDGDGKSNLQEYLFDTDPQTGETGHPELRVSSHSSGSISLEIDTLEGRQYRLMYSDDLLSWKPGSEKILGQRTRLPFVNDGTGLIQSAPNRRYYRVDVSSP